MGAGDLEACWPPGRGEAALDAGQVAPAPPAPADTNPAPAPEPLAPEQAAAARPVLAPGSGPGDPAVVHVQQYLRVSPATGFFGKLTTKAVTAYQQPDDPRHGDGGCGHLGGDPRRAPGGPCHGADAAHGADAGGPTIPTPAYPLPENPTVADRAVVFALAQVGKPYVLGGNGPAVFDCSGLVQQAYLTAGVKLPRLASQQRFAEDRGRDRPAARR